MIKRKSDYFTEEKENLRGGEGTIKIEHFLTKEELNNNGRLYAKMIMEPGTSIGHHLHEGEMEAYYVLSGEAEYDDNGEKVKLYSGDTALTPVGEGHSIKNTGSTALEIIALIIFK